MPATTRAWAQRELDRGASLIDTVGEHLNRVEDKYRPQHPEIAEAVLTVMTLLAECQELIRALRRKI